MTAGAEVVEDYGHVGLTLRSHPVSFLREDLAARRIVTCAEAMAARDGRWLGGVVLVRDEWRERESVEAAAAASFFHSSIP